MAHAMLRFEEYGSPNRWVVPDVDTRLDNSRIRGIPRTGKPPLYNYTNRKEVSKISVDMDRLRNKGYYVKELRAIAADINRIAGTIRINPAQPKPKLAAEIIQYFDNQTFD